MFLIVISQVLEFYQLGEIYLNLLEMNKKKL
jgi:hypothetical protein